MTLTAIMVALGVTLLVVGATFDLVAPMHHVLSVQAQTADLYQRARMVSARLHRDILNTGVRMDGSEPARAVRPAVLPARLGAAATFEVGAITLVSTPGIGVPAVTVSSLPGRTASVRVVRLGLCPSTRHDDPHLRQPWTFSSSSRHECGRGCRFSRIARWRPATVVHSWRLDRTD